MGNASGSEVEWEQVFGPLENLEDPQYGSLAYLLDQPRDLTITDYIDVSSSLEALNSHILDPIAGSTPKAHAKRHRSKDWSADEKRAYMEAKLEAVREAGKGKEWSFISRCLLKRHGFSRSSKECENLWGTLLKKHRAILQHEKSKRGGPQTSDATNAAGVSYFEMDEESRSRNKFLSLPCYQLMDTIFEEQKFKRSQRSATADHGGPSHTIVEEADDDAQRFIQQCLESFVTEKVEDAVNSRFESLSCRKTCRFSKAEQDKLLSLLASDVKKLIGATVNINLKILASEGYIFDVDDPTAGLAPFVENFIKDALVNAIFPVSSALESLEKKLEAQKKRQDVKEKRLALDREEKEIEEIERALRAIGGIAKRTTTVQQRGRPRRGRSFPPLGIESSRQ